MKTGNLNVLGSLFAGGWQLAPGGYKYFDTAATSYTFSGLQGDTAKEYRLVGFFVNGSALESGWSMQFAGDAGATSYGYQYLRGTDSYVNAGRAVQPAITLSSSGASAPLGKIGFCEVSISAKSGVVRTTKSKSIWSVTGSTVSNIVATGSSWNNTADELTSITVFSSAAGGIAAGSRLFLFERMPLGSEATTGIQCGALNVKGSLNAGVMQRIWEYDVEGSSVSSITTPAGLLNGNTDVLYEVIIRSVSGGGSDDYAKIKLNGSSSSIYGRQAIYGTGTTVAAVRAGNESGGWYISPLPYANGALLQSRVLIYAPTGNVRCGIAETMVGASGTTVGSVSLNGLVFNESSLEVTSLVMESYLTLGLAPGTHIELWALRLN
jgi:hypothetical protein